VSMRRHVIISPFDFRGNSAKLSWLIPLCGTISRSLVKSASVEYHGSRDLRTCNGVSSLCGDRNWLDDS
jgi:hypothetical protein